MRTAAMMHAGRDWSAAHRPATARDNGRSLAPPHYGLELVDRRGSVGRLQLKSRIGAANDPLEHEADRMADAVMSGGVAGPESRAGPGAMQRACAGCAAEDEIVQRKCAACEEQAAPLQRKAAGAGAGGQSVPPVVDSVLGSPGQPLQPAAREFMSTRFGADFSGVRIHADAQAAQSAAAVNARAYTAGRDIVFGAGEYDPGGSTGRRLLAHELAHVLQQRGGSPPVIRRAAYGAGTLPGRNWIPPPADEHAHVDEAMAKIDAVVADPATFRECHEQYASKCPGGGPGTLATVWNRARIWRIPGDVPNVYARAPVNGSDIAYTSLGYSQNATDLAATLMHEGGHNCGIPGGDTHWHAELVSKYCMTPGQNSFSISAGPSLTGGDPTMLFSYRRFLGDWAGGRLRATLGADFNLIGTILEAGLSPGAHEFGSVTGGVQLRAGGWGGTRYGGISFRLETGIGAGRFALPPATPGAEPATEIMPDVIMQIGPRAEFLIPTGDAHVFPLSVGAAYRLAQPLNSEASALHSALFTLEANF